MIICPIAGKGEHNRSETERKHLWPRVKNWNCISNCSWNNQEQLNNSHKAAPKWGMDKTEDGFIGFSSPQQHGEGQAMKQAVLLPPSPWQAVSAYLAVQKKVVWFDISMDKAQLMNRINGKHSLSYIELCLFFC